MRNGEKVVANLPLSWKNSFGMGVVIPSTNRFCSDCDTDSLCDTCNRMVKQSKKFLGKSN